MDKLTLAVLKEHQPMRMLTIYTNAHGMFGGWPIHAKCLHELQVENARDDNSQEPDGLCIACRRNLRGEP